MDPELVKKRDSYEARKARTKELLALRHCTICGEDSTLRCPCKTTAYCSVTCQKVDWHKRGHRKVCKEIRDERVAKAVPAEAPTPPPSPPKEIFYGPAPRSRADEVRARIAAEHDAARARREATPEQAPASGRYGSRCPICIQDWDVNELPMLQTCCCRLICASCEAKTVGKPCPLCRAPAARSDAEQLTRIRRHVANEVPEAVTSLGTIYRDGTRGLVKSVKKAAKLYKRAVELENVDAMINLGQLHVVGDGVKVDKKKAAKLFSKAADRGDAIAQFNLAQLLPTDEALCHFESAARQGLSEAEFTLGTFYCTGELAADVDKATRWFASAAAKGHERAKNALRVLEHVVRDGPGKAH